MTTLAYLNEPSVLWNLKARYQTDDIYTYTGSILIAVNPFAPMPHLYGLHMMEQYRGLVLGELSPHVYAIADESYRQMRKEGRSQSILVRRCVALPPCCCWRCCPAAAVDALLQLQQVAVPGSRRAVSSMQHAPAPSTCLPARSAL